MCRLSDGYTFYTAQLGSGLVTENIFVQFFFCKQLVSRSVLFILIHYRMPINWFMMFSL